MLTSSSRRHAAVTFRAVKGGTVALDAMVTLHLSGRRAVGVQQRFDIDRDGRFSEIESVLVSNEVKGESMGGVTFKCCANAKTKSGSAKGPS